MKPVRQRHFLISAMTLGGLLFSGCLNFATFVGSPKQLSGTPAPPITITPAPPYTGPILADGATVSAFLGVNVDSDFPFNDIRYNLTGFNPTAGGTLDTNGYPAAGVSGSSQSDIGETLPSGVYNFSYVGTGTVTFSGIASQVSAWTQVNGEWRTQVQVTGTPGRYPSVLNINITNQPGQSVTDIHFLQPGVSFDSTEIFSSRFLAAIAPFRQLRLMDWLATNASALEYWSDRTSMTYFGSAPFGMPYEILPALANETGKDLWINIPELANNDFLAQLGQFLAANLDYNKINAARKAQGVLAPFKLIFEWSNETWNGGVPSFTAFGTLLTDANLEPAIYTGVYTGPSPDWVSAWTDLMKVAQIEADKVVSIGTVMRPIFAQIGHPETIELVLGGWAIASNYSYEGLDYISKHYPGPVSNYVDEISMSGYFNANDNETDLPTFFAHENANIDSSAQYFQNFKNVSTHFGVGVVGYESGVGDTMPVGSSEIIHLAMHDVRMHDAEIRLYNLWKKYFGDSRLNQFTLSTGLGVPEVFFEYGFWGSLESLRLDLTTCGQNMQMLTGTESISSVIMTCPRYQAMVEQIGQ